MFVDDAASETFFFCFISEHHLHKFPVYSSEGIIVAGIEEILQDFTSLVGCHHIRDKQLLVDDLLNPKGRFKRF